MAGTIHELPLLSRCGTGHDDHAQGFEGSEHDTVSFCYTNWVGKGKRLQDYSFVLELQNIIPIVADRRKDFFGVLPQ